jgi:hypothetical protein
MKMLSHNFPFDTVQMPLNCFDATFRSFAETVLPELNRRGIAPLGMKSFGGSGEMLRHGDVTPQEALSYAMSLPVAVTISASTRSKCYTRISKSRADFSHSHRRPCTICGNAAARLPPTAGASFSR